MAKLSVGSVVVNFGIKAEVVSFLSDGSPILQSLDRGDRWAADLAKCEAVAGYGAVFAHPPALVMVGR